MAFATLPQAKRNLEAAVVRALSLLAPPPEQTVSEWADQFRYLSAESSASPGKYRTERTEYARGIMDAFSEPGVERVVVMSSAQVAKTTIVENIVAALACNDPGPILVVQPTLEMAETFSKDRVAPMIRDNPELLERFADAGSRKGGNTLLHKQFWGGHLTMIGANSPASLASRPIRFVLFDEVDRYETTSEGDVVLLAEKRSTAFWNRRIGYFSTPGDQGRSRIEQLYAASDQRRYFVDCFRCHREIELLWDSLKWTEAPVTIAADGSKVRRALDAWFECPECGVRIGDVERNRAVRAGRWLATAECNGVAGFWMWQGISPFRTALETANEWLAALGRPDQEKVVKNTVRGETWQVSGDVPEWESLWARLQGKARPAVLPSAVCLITAGIDVQADRVEIQVVGWGRGKRSWLIDYVVIPGKPTDLENPDAELSKRLRAEIGRSWQHPAGPMLSIARAAIDDGYESLSVRAFARLHRHGLIVVKGYDTGVALLGVPAAIDVLSGGAKAKHGVRSWPANVSMAKHELYQFLRLPFSDPSLPGWCEFYDAGREFFEQLCAEHFVTKLVKGFAKGQWEKRRERNEALDTRNLARVAAAHAGMDRWSDPQWDEMEASLLEARPIEIAPAESAADAAERREPAPRPQARRSSDFWGGGRGYW